MPYIKVLDVEGKEHEYQFINNEYVSLSYGHKKFMTLDDVQYEFKKQCEADYEVNTRDEDMIIDDYFASRDLCDIVEDQNYDMDMILKALSMVIRSRKRRGNFDLMVLVNAMADLGYTIEEKKE